VIIMKTYPLVCALLLALAACASQPPRCGRLTPINRQSMPSDFNFDIHGVAAHSAKAPRP
jgi:hypothetical protein